MEKKSTLASLEVGQEAIIKTVGAEGALRRHFLNMGMTPGTEVTLIKRAPLGDPIEIEIRGYELTLRLADAEKIDVTDIHLSNHTHKSVERIKDIPHPRRGEFGVAHFTEHAEKPKITIPNGKRLCFALIGNPNSGKTTLFNQLTGSCQHVGNFPGVTVEKKDGIMKKCNGPAVTDLPGIYSLSPYSKEEIITRDFLLKRKPAGIINIVDATNLERNLLLTTQLLQLGIPMVVALNMMDELTGNGGSVLINKLEDSLGVPVVPISAARNEGIDELIAHAIHVAEYAETPVPIDFCSPDESSKEAAVHRCVHAIEHVIEDHAKAAGLPLRFAASKLIEGDSLIEEALKLGKNEKDLIKHAIVELEWETNLDSEAAIADMSFSFIERLTAETLIKPHKSKEQERSSKIDKILTGKHTALISFFAIMVFIFWMTFGVIGLFLSNGLEFLIDKFTAICDNALSVYGINPAVHSLVIDGVFAGVGSVLSFLPTIVVLFFFLSILEDSGYMARIAFVMDKLLRQIGLSGRSIVPVLMGFGCSVPAIMASRTLSSDRDRRLTILLTPFMSCSAKLPIYAMFSMAFFPKHSAIVMISLYFLGILIGVLYAIFLKFTGFRGEPIPFVMELPNYRLPSAKSVYMLVFEKAKDFVVKAFTIIFLASIVIWFLQTFDSRFNVVENSSDSLLAMAGGFIAPIFRPLGFDDWRISTALLTGFIAKENVVSTLAVLLGGSGATLNSLFTPLSAYVFLIFTLLYTPCVAAVAAVKREMGTKWVVAVVISQCAIAWISAFAFRILIGFTIFRLI
ncbi:MAG: ferrous iron transport protein B [Treponema sp.]|jgi:ferrous iron transport protein B|nr:ferrous iron transport protein B [Treponema sp.]